MREARTAIGITPFPDEVITNFSVHLAPYRKRNGQYIQLSFYLVASSVLAKAPLPAEAPAELETGRQLANFTHDALVLAARHAKTEEAEGRKPDRPVAVPPPRVRGRTVGEMALSICGTDGAGTCGSGAGDGMGEVD